MLHAGILAYSQVEKMLRVLKKRFVSFPFQGTHNRKHAERSGVPQWTDVARKCPVLAEYKR